MAAQLNLQAFQSPLFQLPVQLPSSTQYYLSDNGKVRIDEVAQVIIQFMGDNPYIAGPSQENIIKCLHKNTCIEVCGDSFKLSKRAWKRMASEDGEAEAASASPPKRRCIEFNLNVAQQGAVEHKEGPMLVLAGPGSGKTRVITERIQYLIESAGVKPEQIVALTFTKKAAREMKERLAGVAPKGLTIKTFHSLALQIIMAQKQHIPGLERGFSILDGDEREGIIKSCYNGCITTRKNKGEESQIKALKLDAKRVAHKISVIKGTGKKFKEGDYLDGVIQEIFDAYERKREGLKKIDFDDMLKSAVELFRRKKELLEEYRAKWPYLLIDEFQDTNPRQFEFIQLLCSKAKNVFAVGDPKQSIYRFRGAMPAMLEKFKEYFGCDVILLDENYRCKQAILDVAHSVLTEPGERQMCTRGEGEKVSVVSVGNKEDEVRFVVERIQHHLADGCKAGEIAILFRTNSQSAAFQEACEAAKISCKTKANADHDEEAFYAQDEIKGALSFLRLAADLSDTQSFQIAKRSLDKRASGLMDKIFTAWSQSSKGMTLLEFCKEVCASSKGYEGLKLPVKDRKVMNDFIAMFEELHKEIEEGAQAALNLVLERVGYKDFLKRKSPKGWKKQEEQLAELMRRAEGRGVKEFIKPPSDRVHIMTLHCAKGLEFETVFLVEMEEGSLPHFNSEGDEGIKEEERLCYVGMTRAKDRLYLTHAEKRYSKERDQSLDREPSRFLEKLPEEAIERVTYP